MLVGLLITLLALDFQVKATSLLRLGTCYYPFVFEIVGDDNLTSAFAVGVVANIYGRLFNGNAFVVMVTYSAVIPWLVCLRTNLLCNPFSTTSRSQAYCFSCPRALGTEGYCILRRSRLLGTRHRT